MDAKNDPKPGELQRYTEKIEAMKTALQSQVDDIHSKLLGDIQQVSHYVEITPTLQCVMNVVWPGPVTLVLLAKKGTSEFLVSKDNAIAIRIPDHRELRNILLEVGGLFSTSANIAGQEVPQTIDALDPVLMQSISLMVGEDEEVKKQPSTILDCTGDTIKILREGAFQADELVRRCKIEIVKQ